MSMIDSQRRCPICLRQDSEIFFVTESMPVFCNILCSSQAEAVAVPTGDIHLAYCEHCGHVYNARFDSALISYTAPYENSLHFSPRFQQYAAELVDGLIDRYDFDSKKIIDIGAGRGDFLSLLVNRSNSIGIAIDPSIPEDQASDERITFVKDHFSARYSDYGAALILCRHVLEHVEAPLEFLQMVRSAMGGSGPVAFFEVPNVEFTICHNGIWDIIYEHFSYFSARSLTYAFRQSGFDIVRVDTTFGEQFLTIEAVPRPSASPPEDVDEDEHTLKQSVDRFAAHYEQQVARWRRRLAALSASGGRAVIWGTGSKGVTFMNVMRKTPAITHAVDISPRKHGMYAAGVGIEIIPPARLTDLKPDLIIVMNANYQGEVTREVRRLGLNAVVELA